MLNVEKWPRMCNKCCMSFIDPFHEYNYCPRCGVKIIE